MRNKTHLDPADLPFLDDLQSAIIMQKTPKSMRVLWLLLFVVVTALIWAHFAVVEEVTKGEARVIPASHEQIIESFEDGTLEALFVKEGERVEKGQPLLKLDSTRPEANYQEELSKSSSLKAAIARARAEAYELPLIFPEGIRDSHTLIQDETQAYQTRRKLLEESISSLSHNLRLAEEEVNLSEPLAKRGLISDMEILRLRRQVNDLRLQIADRTNKYHSEANSELTRLESELAQVEARLIGRKDVIKHALITAPVRGTINNIKSTTINGVISRGEQIMSLIPSEDNLLLETRIKPTEVAFIRPDLPATVKISAYDFAIYGGLDGVIESISPDTLIDETKARSGREDATYYRVYVRTHGTVLHVKDKSFPIIPGMTASVEIKTGEKTILSYLLKPVLKAREAFRER